MQKNFCDTCNKELTNPNYWERTRCSQNSHGEYHKECLVEVFGALYCKVHSHKAENKKLISDYVAKVWSDMGYVGTVNQNDGVVKATVGPLNMEITPEYDGDATVLACVNLNVRGLTSGIRTFKASLCEHETIVQQLQGAIVRSLPGRSDPLSLQSRRKRNRWTRKLLR